MKQASLDILPIQRVSHNPAIQKQVMLKKGDLPHLVQFSQAKFDPGQVAPAHSHSDMHEVFFVESGDGQIAIDDDDSSAEARHLYCRLSRRSSRSPKYG